MITLKTRLAALALAAALPLTLAACSKGGSSSNADTTPGGTTTLTMWTHNAGNKNELAAVQQIVTDYNASQTKYKVDVQAFPQDSYNQSVVAAAAAKKLPASWTSTAPTSRTGRGRATSPRWRAWTTP